MTIPASWRVPLVCLGVVTVAAAGIAIASPVHADTATVEVIWLMPVGATPDNVLYDQLHLQGGVAEIPCGRWAQGDHYLREEAARFTADGKLTEGEDHASDFPVRLMGVISWDFYYGGDCAPGVVAASAAGELAATGSEYSPLWFAPGAFAVVFGGSMLLLRARRRSQKL